MNKWSVVHENERKGKVSLCRTPSVKFCVNYVTLLKMQDAYAHK